MLQQIGPKLRERFGTQIKVQHSKVNSMYHNVISAKQRKGETSWWCSFLQICIRQVLSFELEQQMRDANKIQELQNRCVLGLLLNAKSSFNLCIAINNRLCQVEEQLSQSVSDRVSLLQQIDDTAVKMKVNSLQETSFLSLRETIWHWDCYSGIRVGKRSTRKSEKYTKREGKLEFKLLAYPAGLSTSSHSIVKRSSSPNKWKRQCREQEFNCWLWQILAVDLLLLCPLQCLGLIS